MFLHKKIEIKDKLIEIDVKNDATKNVVPQGGPSLEVRLEELEALPRRNPILHWIAFVLSLISLILLTAWVFSSHGPVPTAWIVFDIGLGITTLVEFFTRSGFKWNRGAYLRTHFFDFVAIVPALALVNHGIAIELVWVWIILVARFVRVIDRLGGDGFVQRNIWALLEGLEEEITDRVLQRMITRIQGDMDRANFSHGVAEAFVKNKSAVLQRVRAATPHDGVVPNLAHIVGLDAALERAEERTYDAVVQIIDSQEVDHAVRDVINSVFSRMTSELGEKSWRHKLGIRHHQIKK
jgi:energy-coupling factor transporter transmembrane protein EcfT